MQSVSQQSSLPISLPALILVEKTVLEKPNAQFVLSSSNSSLIVETLRNNPSTIVVLIGQENQYLYGLGQVRSVSAQIGEFSFINGLLVQQSLKNLVKLALNKQTKTILKDLFEFSEGGYLLSDSNELEQLINPEYINYHFCSKPVKFLGSIPNAYPHQKSQFVWIQSPVTKLIDFCEDLPESRSLAGVPQASNNINVFKRILREVEDVNRDFFNLRTLVYPDNSGKINTFYFMMFPNDGAFCSLPLIGRIIIPKEYPKEPPVFHLFTMTSRFNLDVYRGYLENETQSSVCFDIVKPTSMNVSTWKSDYTISTVFASMMDVIVSVDVQQMHGGSVQEFVSMEKLRATYQSVLKEIKHRKNQLVQIPRIPAITAVPVMCNPLYFEEYRFPEYKFTTGERSLVSNGFKLQQGYHSVRLRVECPPPQFVVSFILTNDPKDPVGKRRDTILFRNGVTATAAVKWDGDQIRWFYHGKPLNKNEMDLTLTVSPNQFCMSYRDEFTDGKWLVHGDTPIASLQKQVVGVLAETFYLVIYVRNKTGKEEFTMRKTNSTVGYVHSNYQ